MGQEGSKWQGYKHQLDEDKNQQSVKIPNSEEKGATAIFRNPRAKDKFLMYLKLDEKDEKSEELNTGWACFKASAAKNAKEKCFGYRPFVDTKNIKKRAKYRFDTYAEVMDDILKVGNGLATLGLTAKCAVGLYSINRPEWMTSHLAGWSQGFKTTALYDSLGAQAVQYIIWHSEMEIIFVSKRGLVEVWKGLKIISESNEKDKLKLRYVVQFDPQKKYNNMHENVENADKDKAKSFNVELMGLTELMKKAGDKKDLNPPKSEDLAYIMYTSGTTGDPKGVMLTQKAFACIVGSTIRGLEENGDKMSPLDSHVSFLPLAHSFESAVLMCLISVGAHVAFFQGNIKKISDDWREILPTFLAGVPRIFSKTYDKVFATAQGAGGIKKLMFNNALGSSSKEIRSGRRSGMYDWLVWQGIAEKIGYNKIRFLASGAAPLSPHIAEFLRIVCAKAVVSQGYGLTETLAVSFFTKFNDLTLGHIGIPTDNIEFRLVDAPECEYYTTDKPLQRGEIQLRGPTVMSGYFKNEDKTKVSLSKDGWFSTGDIGRVNFNGTLSIIDRRKNMFKTASGEYIAAEKLETIYSQSSGVSQIWIYGNSFKEFVVSIIVPDALHIVQKFIEKGFWTDDDKKLTPATKEYNEKFLKVATKNHDFVHAYIKGNLKAVEKTNDIKKFEYIRDFFLEFELDELLQGFNVINGCQTPTFKLKRPYLRKKYLQKIKDMYTKNGSPPKENENWE